MNKRIKTALILIAIIIIALFAISLAYSKHFTKITGTGEATVAKWSFKVNGKEDNLGTIILGNTQNSKVANGKIAPGTNGKFAVNLDASGSEVAIDYTIKFENVNGNFPKNLKFYSDEKYSNEIQNITEVGLTGSIELNEINNAKTVEFYWKWDYQTGTDEAADIEDTKEGKNAQSISFDIAVTGIQKENV